MALWVGLVLITAIFYQQTGKTPLNENGDDMMVYIFPTIGIMGIFMSKVLFSQLLKNLENKGLLSEKLSGYLTASLIQFALVEGPAFLNIIWFNTTGNMLYFAVALVLIVYLAWLRPSKSKIENQLQLKGELLSQFRKENEKLL